MKIRDCLADPDEGWLTPPNAPWLLITPPTAALRPPHLVYGPGLEVWGSRLFRRPEDCILLGRAGIPDESLFGIFYALDRDGTCSFVGDLSPFHVALFLLLREEDRSHLWRWRGVSLAMEAAVDLRSVSTRLVPTLSHHPSTRQRRRERELWLALATHYSEELEEHFAPEERALLAAGSSIPFEALLARYERAHHQKRLCAFLLD